LNISKNKELGQSAVEFVLITPILFLIFFGIIQLFYCGFVSLAIQKATNAIAQQASASGDAADFEPHFQIITALFPIEKLNASTLIYAISCKCDIQEQNHIIKAVVSYPMPIWMPIIGNVFGQPLNNTAGSLLGLSNDLLSFLGTIGLKLPSFNLPQNTPNVIWFTFEARCLDENFVGSKT